MPKKTSNLSNRFQQRARALESTRVKIEALHVQGNIDIADVEQVYAGLFLDIFTEFESLLEELFLGLLTGNFYSTNTVQRRVKFMPTSMAREVVFGGKDYLEWLPYDGRTLERAKRFFVNSSPFAQLTPVQITNLKNYHSIRNAIAHKSDFAQNKFKKMISHLTLLPREKTPIGYLRSKPSITSNQTQYEIAVIDLEIMAINLCS